MTGVIKHNVIVTGGLGYIGSHTVVKLIESGWNPIIVDNLSNSSKDTLDVIENITGKRPEFYEGDIRQQLQTILPSKYKKEKIEAIIHFAGKKSVKESIVEPMMYYDNNVNGMLQIIRSMKIMDITNIVFSSSCTVYGQPESFPVHENSPLLEPESVYGQTKRMCEQILEGFVNNRREPIKVVALRYFNPIGAHPSGKLKEPYSGTPENLIPYITEVIKKERQYLNIFGSDYNTDDGTAIRDYINVNDLADAHVKALYRCSNLMVVDSFDVINVGSGSGYSVLEILEKFEDEGIDILYKMMPRRKGDIEKIYGDITKAKEVLDWEPKTSLQETIKSIINTLDLNETKDKI